MVKNFSERELLCTVESYKNLSKEKNVYAHHKNVTYKSFNSEQLMSWRLLLEKFISEPIYIKGSKYIVVDAFSLLDK